MMLSILPCPVAESIRRCPSCGCHLTRKSALLQMLQIAFEPGLAFLILFLPSSAARASAHSCVTEVKTIQPFLRIDLLSIYLLLTQVSFVEFGQ